MNTLEQAVFARKVLEHVTAHPEEHDQSTFGIKSPECGTVMCIAGTACMMDSTVEVLWETPHHSQPHLMEGKLIMGGVYRESDGMWNIVPNHAADLMGLSKDAAEELFFEFDNAKAIGILTDHVTLLENLATQGMGMS